MHEKAIGSRVARLVGPTLALTLVALPAAALSKLERKVLESRLVYEELLSGGDRRVPQTLVEEARCIMVIPDMLKGALGFGGRHGTGVVSCRDPEKGWSPPAFVKISGASFGLQIGLQATDLVLFFTTERGARSLLQSEFTLGGDLSVAAGPLGRTAGVSTDLKLKAEIYAYAKSRGLFAGASLEGARLAVSQKAISRYYGERIWPDDLLFEHQAPTIPPQARDFMAALP